MRTQEDIIKSKFLPAFHIYVPNPRPLSLQPPLHLKPLPPTHAPHPRPLHIPHGHTVPRSTLSAHPGQAAGAMAPQSATSGAPRPTGPQRVRPSSQLPEVVEVPKGAVPQQHVQAAVEGAAGEVYDVHGAPPWQWRARSFASDTYRRSSNKKNTLIYAIYSISFIL